MAYGPVNYNLGTIQTAGPTNTGTIKLGGKLGGPPPGISAAQWAAYQQSPHYQSNVAAAPGAGVPAAGAPGTPTALTGTMNYDPYGGNLFSPGPTATPTTPASAPVGNPTSLTGTISPLTPQTSLAGPMTAQNLPQWASEAGRTAASFADPFAEQRPQYQQQLAKLMSDPGSLATSPLYKFAQEQGLEAVNRTAGARGQLGSGNRLADLTRYGTGLAGENFFKMAPLLGRFAGADTSSPAAAGSAYAYGQGKAMDAFSNQEMERAYRDAMERGLNAAPNTGMQQPPLAAPLSTDPYRDQYYANQGQTSPVVPNAPPSNYFPAQPGISDYYNSPLSLDYAPDGGYGYTSPGAEQLAPQTGGGGFYDQYGGNYDFGQNPPLDQGGGAMDMGVGMNYDPWNPYGQQSPTLSRISGQLPANYQQPAPNLFGDWGFLGSRG